MPYDRFNKRILIGYMLLPLMCILLAGVIYQRVRRGCLEGMATMNGGGSNPAVEDLKKQVDLMQTTYDQLQNGVEDQTNRIHANAQMLLKVMSDTPNQTNDLTHANVNMDDPSKTKIPKIIT